MNSGVAYMVLIQLEPQESSAEDLTRHVEGQRLVLI